MVRIESVLVFVRVRCTKRRARHSYWLRLGSEVRRVLMTVMREGSDERTKRLQNERG